MRVPWVVLRQTPNLRKKMSKENITLASILLQDVVSQVITKQREGEGLIFAVKGEELGMVALKMAKRGISALPVFSDPARKSCLGLVDFADIVTVILSKCEADHDLLHNKEKFWHALTNMRVELAVDASGRDSAVEIPLDATLKVATQLFAQFGVKRLLVIDESKKVVGILSPSALTSHAVARLRGILDPTLAQTVEQLSLGSGPVISVTKTRPFVEAMILMRQSRHSCLAVIDDTTHVLAGSVSMSDIKMLFVTEDFSLLSMTCWDFIVLSRSLQDSEQFPFFGVGPDSKILSVVSKLLATAVHHVYVVDATLKPKKVIGFSDVCKVMCM